MPSMETEISRTDEAIEAGRITKDEARKVIRWLADCIADIGGHGTYYRNEAGVMELMAKADIGGGIWEERELREEGEAIYREKVAG